MDAAKADGISVSQPIAKPHVSRSPFVPSIML